MTPVQQFAQELTSMFQYGSPIGCSRSELALDETNNMVMLLLRTKPELSEWMFSTPPLEYPMPLLQNYDFTLFKLWHQIMEQRTAVPAVSELMRAAMAGVSKGNSHGTSVDIGTFGPVFSVPDISSSPEWEAVLIDPQYPFFTGQEASAVQFFVAHLPDVPVRQLDDAQLHQVAQLSVGWNYLGVEEGFIPAMAQAIRVAATEPQVITGY